MTNDRDRDGTEGGDANAAPVPQDCQARAGTASPTFQPTELSDNILHRNILEDPAGDVVERLYNLVRPFWHYAKPGTPDGAMFDASERGQMLRKSVKAIATLTSSTPVASNNSPLIDRIRELEHKLTYAPVASGEVGLEPTQEVLGRIAYAIIEGSAGVRAADHARNFVTANWTDAVRSARNVLTEIAALSTPTPDDVGKIVAWLRAARHPYVSTYGLDDGSGSVFVTTCNNIANAIERGDWRDTPSDQGWPSGDPENTDCDGPAGGGQFYNPSRQPPAPTQGWRPIKSAPQDGTEILILAHGMAIQARFEPGRWTEETPLAPREYDGPVWCGFDDQVTFEIEEFDLDEHHHGPVTHWQPLPPPPADSRSPEGSVEG